MKKIILQTKNSKVIGFAFLLLTLFGCGQNPAQGPTGSIAFSLGVASQDPLQKGLDAPSVPIDCIAQGITTIQVVVVNAQNTTVASKDFACSLHAGTVENVPVGMMKVVIHALNAQNKTMHQGQSDSVSVSAGTKSSLGHIVLAATAGIWNTAKWDGNQWGP